MLEKIEGLIIEALKEYQDMNDIALEINGRETPIFGPNSQIDSFGLVSLIVEVEEKVGSSFDVQIMLTDEKAMSRKNSPFRTVGTLADYIESLISGKE